VCCRWTVDGPNFRSAGQPGRRGRSWRLEALRMCPEPNAEKCQEEPQRLQNRQLALYESRRHRLRGQRISKRLVKDQKEDPRRGLPILRRRSVAGVSPDGGSDDSSLAGQWLTLSFSYHYSAVPAAMVQLIHPEGGLSARKAGIRPQQGGPRYGQSDYGLKKYSYFNVDWRKSAPRFGHGYPAANRAIST
jgi:hypothetical protein